jgi:hypothetical protein
MIMVRFFVPFDWEPKIKPGLERERKRERTN